MPHVIAEPCIGVKAMACVEACPVDAIHPCSDEAGFEEAEQLYIDPDTCIDCGACNSVCPENAPFAEEDLSRKWADYREKNAVYYSRDKTAPAPALQAGPVVKDAAAPGRARSSANRSLEDEKRRIMQR